MFSEFDYIANLRLRQPPLQILRTVFDEAFGFFDESGPLADQLPERESFLGGGRLGIADYLYIVHAARSDEDGMLHIA